MRPADFIRIHSEFDEAIAKFWAKHGAEMLEECLYEAAAAHIIAFKQHERFCKLVQRFEQYEKEIDGGNSGPN